MGVSESDGESGDEGEHKTQAPYVASLLTFTLSGSVPVRPFAVSGV